jgi:hypothetical protein
MATLAERDPTGILRAGPGETELPGHRTRHFKKFQLDGRTFRVGGDISPIHYRADPFDESLAFEEIDLDVRSTPGQQWDAACESNGYQVRFWQSRQIAGRTVRYIAQFRRAGRWFAMAPVALGWMNNARQWQLISTPKTLGAPTIDDVTNTVTWYGAFGTGLDFQYSLKPDKFFKQLIIEGNASLPTPTIGMSGLRLVLLMAVSWDAGTKAGTFANAVTPADLSDDLTDALGAPDEQATDPAAFSQLDEQSRDLWWFQKPVAWDSGGPDPETGFPKVLPVQWRLLRKASRCFMAFSVTATALNVATYPVYMDTTITEELVAASGDDAYSGGGSWPGTGTDKIYSAVALTFGIGWNTTAPPSSITRAKCMGMRFLTIPVAQGVVVDTSTVQIYYDGTVVGTPSLKVHGDDHDDAAIWANTTNVATGSPGDRTRTTAASPEVSLSGGAAYKSWNVKTVVQEIVDRALWASNNDMAFMLMSSSAINNDEQATMAFFDDSPSHPAKLNITYHTISNYDETGKAQSIKVAQTNSAAATRKETAKAQAILVAQAIGGQAATRGELNRSQPLLIAQTIDGQTVIRGDLILSQLLLIAQEATDVYIPISANTYDETGKEQLLLLDQVVIDAAIRAELGLEQPLLIVQGAAAALFASEIRAQWLLMQQAEQDIAAFMESRPQSIFVSQAISDRAVRTELELNQGLLIVQGINGGILYEELGRNQVLLIVQQASELQAIVEALSQQLRIEQAGAATLLARELARSQVLLIHAHELDWYPTYWDLLVRLPKPEGIVVVPADALRLARIPIAGADELMVGLPTPEGIVWLPAPPEIRTKIKGR